MDADQVATLRALLANSGWLERAGILGRALRTRTTTQGGLLVVGTPAEEPWHLTAHLDEESRLSGIAELMPTLVRWAPPPGAPPHLAVGLSRLEEARRGETLFVVAPDAAPAPLLERVNDARHVGATILALDQGDSELEGLAHEFLVVPGIPSAGAADKARAILSGEALSGETLSAETLSAGPDRDGRAGLLTFDSAQHLVSAAAGERDAAATSRGIRSLRGRLARFLDAVSGPNA